MFLQQCAFLVVAVSTSSVHGQRAPDYYGPGLGGMSYHPYHTRSAYIPTGHPSSLGPSPIREPLHPKNVQPLLHDFHTPVDKRLDVPPPFPAKDIGFNAGPKFPPHLGAFSRGVPPHGGFGGLPDPARGFVPHGAFGRFHDPIRSIGAHGAYGGGVHYPLKTLGPQSAFGGVPDSIKNVGPHGAYGGVPFKNVGPLYGYDGVPLKNVGPLNAFGGVAGPLPAAEKGIDITSGAVPNALTNKNIALPNPNIALPNPVTGTVSKDAIHGAGYGAYPNQINKGIGYPGPGGFGGSFLAKNPLGDFSDPGYAAGLDKTFGGYDGPQISEPFLTPVGRVSGGYSFQRVPLALLEGRFIGHHFGTPVVHGIVKAGVPVSLTKGW